MVSTRQKTLLIDPGAPARVWCKECGQPLTDKISRMRRLGEECDPEPRTADPGRHEVDQDPLPGM